SYRFKQTFTKDKILEAVRSKIPTRNQLLHQLLKKGFEQDGFKFEEIRQGDAVFNLIRKTIRPGNRRLILVPGLGDSPGSWILSFGLSRRKLIKSYDELVILDFPGYLGFLSHHKLAPTMAMLQSFVRTVCDANPPHTLMGHSLGGWLVGKYAQDLCRPGISSNPDAKRLQQLVLIAPSGLTPMEERQAFADFILEGQKLTIQELLERVVYDPKMYQLLLKEEFRQFYAQPEIKQFIDSVKQEEFLDESQPFATDRLAIIWGDHDRFVPAQWMRHWIERFGPYTDAYLMMETGHLPQLERPQALSEVVFDALGLSSSALEGKHWKKIQSRTLSFTSSLREGAGNSSPKL
ncbi:MAG: alpha/beta hydrolase, partial [Phycisphaeraceae bacterium]|nr:alpha/beta hydrolase [Phycisphaeraceae bacterium]